MRKLLVLAAAAALAVVPAADAAKKGKKKAHKVTVNATVQAHTVNSQGIIAGVLTDPVLGQGATVYRTSTTGSSGGVTTENVTFKAWTDQGAISGTGTLAVKSSASPITFTGSGTVTGGAGKYKGAKGTLTFSGGFDSANNVTATVTGSFTYTG